MYMKKILSWSWFIFTRVLIPFFVILLAYDYGNNAALISMSIIIYTTISYAIDQLTKLQSLRFLSMSERLVNIGNSSKTIGKDQKGNNHWQLKIGDQAGGVQLVEQDPR